MQCHGADRRHDQGRGFSGDYGATEGKVTLLAGAGGISMKNRRNNVAMNLKSETRASTSVSARRA